jgi:site-specific DNA-methyltransferase (adenine-specific)
MSAVRLLEALREKSAGAVILDPPTHLGVGATDDETAVDEMIAELTPIAEGVRQVLHPGGASLMMGGPQTVSAWEVAAAWADLRPVAEILVLWDSDSVGHLASLSTTVRWHVRPGHRYSFHAPGPAVESNVVVCQPVPVADRANAAQRPVELFNYLISLLTEKGDLVVDPFCGSGSALVAAEMCGRRWVGSDVDPNQCLAAITRTGRVELEEADLRPLYLWARGEPLTVEG